MARRGLGALLVVLGAITVCLANPDLDRVVELAREHYGMHAAQTVDTWRDLVETNRDLPELEKLELVNTFFNHNVDFEPDALVWGGRTTGRRRWRRWDAGRATARTTASANT